MTGLFMRVCKLSLSASWVVLAVLVARICLKKAPKWMRCALWALVAVRLILPVSLESRLSLIPDQDTIPQAIQEAATDSSPGEVVSIYSEPSPTDALEEGQAYVYMALPAADGSTEVTDSLPLWQNTGFWLAFGSCVWLAGIVLMAGYAAVSYWQLRRRVQASIDLGNDLYLCDYIDSPFILGIVNPKIYLPSEMEPKNASHVLAHERAHLARKDHWWKPIGFSLLALHWFNPLLWVAYILLCRDIELACDEKVVRDFDTDARKEYSEALLTCSVSHRRIVACPLAFGEVGVKQRVKSVLHYKKPGFWMLLAGVAAIVVVAVCFMTEPYDQRLSDLHTRSREEVTSIELWSRKGYAALTLSREMEEVWLILEEVPYGPEPVSDTPITEEADEYDWAYPCIKFKNDETEEYECLYFSHEYDAAWYYDGTTHTLPYSVVEPERIQNLMENKLDSIMDETVTAKPFAGLMEPEKWLQGITMEAIASARTKSYEGHSGHGTSLTRVRAEELMAILNSIPAEALSNHAQIGSSGMDQIVGILSEKPNMCVTLEDRANELAAVLRYYVDVGDVTKLELVLFDNMRYFEERGIKILGAQKWDIDSPELLAYLKELIEHPPHVATFVGAEYDWVREPIVVSGGGATISVKHIKDWETEVTQYTEGCESFGVRVRPKSESDGWIYYSFWPNGYVLPDEVNRLYLETMRFDFKGYISLPVTHEWQGYGMGYENSIWSYQRYMTDTGDYAIINEGADSWILDYEDAISDISLFSNFEGGTQTDFQMPEPVMVEVDYPQSDIERQDFIIYQFDNADAGNFTVNSGWIYEDKKAEYNDHVYYGAFWPEYLTTGRITLEYWEGKFPEDGLKKDEASFLAYLVSEYYPQFHTLLDENGNTCLVMDREQGSYVFRFEDTEEWSEFRFEMAIHELSQIRFRSN